jgi:hypothetical protein
MERHTRGTRASLAPGTASGESTGPKRTELPSDTNQQATDHVRVCAPFRVRREEQYAILGANVVVELYSESHALRPTIRAWAIIRRADRGHRLTSQRTSHTDRRHADRSGRAGRTSRSHQSAERGTAADAL